MKRNFKIDANTFLLLAFLVMAILFISSSMTYKQQTSVPFLEKYLSAEPFKNILSGVSFNYATEKISIAEVGYFKFVEFFLRKGAHFFFYFLMGTFLYLGLKKRLKSILLTVVTAFLATVGYAALDEFHQMITGGRTPLFQDVMLDGIGGIVGILCVGIYFERKIK
ncbi:VanZ family protein [Liquorilactobacillus mali]|uniref:VanZ family protein n=1 Tax=Liquorilactobacillus mali TaxID=1618 RepID=A0A0R2FEH8_9LACO|nr:VanZ family protein [Liquorilactobacillus mali]KRN26864.1 VanZ family protein [Liquorilactobacillus mali]MDN7146542.1 VanZ family protein [Liquorilactobacillus mali]